jgi:outer membrane protein assembly factor BamB
MRDVRMSAPTHRFGTSNLSPVVQRPRVAWKYSFQEGEVDDISVWGETVYCTVDRGRVITALGEDGTPQWRHEIDDPAGHTDDTYWGLPAVTNDTLYISSKGGDLYALDANSGDSRWCSETIGQIPQGSPAVVDGTVYLGGLSGDIFAVDASTGNQRWRWESERVGATTPAVTDGVVYFAHERDGIVYALDADTGRQRWCTKINVERPSAPTVVAGTVYIAGDGGALCALDASSGSQRWRSELSGLSASTPAVVDGTVYYGGKGLHAVDADSGDQYWRFDSGESGHFGPPTVVNRTVYAAGGTGDIYAVDADSGAQYWCFEVDDNAGPVVAAGNNTVYFGDGITVYALKGENTKVSDGTTRQKVEEECSSCGADLTQYGDVALNFCPECGTEMNSGGGSGNAKVSDE